MRSYSQHQITIKKTARYHSMGNLQSPANIWIVLHGYGQLSTFFIRKFQSLDLENDLIIAPEGLHRFYKHGNSGRVGASWMTKEERESDINDYVDYLDMLALSFQHKNSNLIILGFSQGAATASRWATLGSTVFKHLILWSSVFPPDLEMNMSQEKTNGKTTMVYSDNDEFFSVEAFEEQFKELKKSGYIFDTLIFEGKHDIDEHALVKLASRIKKT